VRSGQRPESSVKLSGQDDVGILLQGLGPFSAPTPHAEQLGTYWKIRDRVVQCLHLPLWARNQSIEPINRRFFSVAVFTAL
jgi:hypothetical protein